MYSLQEYCRRLPTEALEMILRNHQEGLNQQCDELIELIYEILRERSVKEEHPGS